MVNDGIQKTNKIHIINWNWHN